MRQSTGLDPGKLTLPDFLDIVQTANAFNQWKLGKGELPMLEGGADPNADLKEMAAQAIAGK